MGRYSLWAGDVIKSGHCSLWGQMEEFMFVRMSVDGEEWPQEEGGCGKLFFDSLKHIYRYITCCNAPHSPLRSTDVLIGMANVVEMICSGNDISLSRWFAEPDLGETRSYGQIQPSLKHLTFYGLELDGGDWIPLTTFLSRRASVGNLLEMLEISHCPHM